MRGVNAVAPNPAEAANTSSHVLAPTRQAPPGCRVEKSCGHINRGCICVGFLCLCGRYHRAHRGGVEWVITEAKEEERKKGVKTKKQTQTKIRKTDQVQIHAIGHDNPHCHGDVNYQRGRRGQQRGVKKEARRFAIFSRVGFGLWAHNLTPL